MRTDEQNALPTTFIHRSTPVVNALLFEMRLPAGALLSYLRLLALAWADGYPNYGPLDMQRDLVPALGLGNSQVYRHLKLLRRHHLLDWSFDKERCYLIRLHAPGPPPSEAAPTVIDASQDAGMTARAPDDGVVESLINNQESQQQHQESQECKSQDGVVEQVRRWLCRADVFSDVALRLAYKIAENEQRGHYYLPDRSDVLGWIAYCFAFQSQNRIAQPVRVLVANLRADRRCPRELRPQQICAACHFPEDRCRCREAAQVDYPEKFLDYAFVADYNASAETFWGVCLECQAYPCQCPPLGVSD